MVKLFGALSLILLSFNGLAQHDNEHHETPHNDTEHHDHDSHLVPKTEFGNDFIVDHVLDAHDWHLFDMPAENGMFKPVSIPLPIILLDGGLKFGFSSAFHHGHSVAEIGGERYFIYKEKIYKTDAANEVTVQLGREELDMEKMNSASANDLIGGNFTKMVYDTVTISFEELAHSEEHFAHADSVAILNEKPWDFSITKNVLVLLITALIMILMFTKVGRFYKKNGGGAAPKGITSWIEPIVVFVRDDIAIPNIGEKKYMKFMPYLLTVFFFIWIANLLGLLPLGFNLTGNIAVTLVLALFTMIITAINGNANYWGHIFWMPGVPVPMKIFLAPIEVIGMFAKPFALMIRLFANITAGHIVIMSLIGVMFAMESIAWSPLSVIMTLFINVLELLVAALQAYVFTMLSALFIGAAVEEAHH